MEKPLQNLTLVLNDIRSVYNVGSIFRTAEAFGVANIILSGYTPAPVDRFGRARKDFTKTALGAEDNVLWQSLPDAEAVVSKLASSEVRIVALEQSEQSEDIRTFDLDMNIETPTALVVGSEVNGVDEVFLREAYTILEIPQFGEKESLNVSVSLGVALYHFVLASSHATNE